MSHTEVFILPDGAVSQLLADNDLSIQDLLKSLGGQIGAELRSDPTADSSEGQSRELVTVLLATAAIIAAATPLLKRGLELLAGRPIVVSEMALAPVINGEGKTVTSSNGEPILYWTERKNLLSPNLPSSESSKLSIQGPLGLKIQLETGNAR